jgi:hypothetical protein
MTSRSKFRRCGCIIEEPWFLPVTGSTVFRTSFDRAVFGERFVRITMTAQTITHAQGHFSGNDLHCLHFAVASLASNASGYVGPMVEVHVIGKRVHTLPFESLAGAVDSRQLLNFRTVSLGHPVAAHASFHTWDSSHS